MCSANGPFGAKEVGQGPLLPIMPAVSPGQSLPSQSARPLPVPEPLREVKQALHSTSAQSAISRDILSSFKPMPGPGF